ncbi:MAG: metallophosphoesterase [Nitrospiraceae bacterium]|nr:metallophosphoesterase [Nitrospiraceae bacterium]
MVFVMVLFQTGLLLCYWLLYQTLVGLLGFHGTWGLKLLFAALSVSFLFASALASRRDGPLSRALYTLSAAWLGLFNFLFWPAVLCRVLYRARMALGLGPYPVSWAAALFSVGLVTGLCGIANAHSLRIKKFDIAMGGVAAGPPRGPWSGKWAGRTAVFVSDLHLGPVRNLGFARRVAKRIREIGPDMLLLGGDFYDGTPADAPGLIAPFSEINPPLGAYFITGNHEEFSARAKQDYIRAASDAGIKVLDNRMEVVEGLQIAGVGYRETLTRAGYERVMRGMGLEKDRPVLLLKHSPMYPDISLREGVDFEICGHTHRGQILPYNLVTRLVYRGFDGGLKRLGNLTIYTSAGAGTWGPPMRVGNRPEIVLIRFV